ncbi:MAG: bacillithiol biosynthesis deacetylase BshB1 [Bernardetiaceae bacterium]|nr:bacillithiol biosynthesis deacetylase BshB1 [Bernardetiaceae bacterium]
MKLDILAFAAHPDDVELSCSGTLMAHIEKGYKVGVVDLTRGELGTRGSADLRDMEARQAAKVMGLHMRDNLGFSDGFFKDNNEHRLGVIRILRKYKPDVVLANSPKDRHPDHERAAKLIKHATFMSGLAKVTTHNENGDPQEAWRPQQLFYYIQHTYNEPDFVFDITAQWERKMQAVAAYKSQFHNPEYDREEAATFISSPEFLEFLKGRARDFGQHVGVRYAEGFLKTKQILLSDITKIA